jgi:uncharacterized membrane protein YdjX (TVP38/TMEM64 family)
MKTDDGLHEQMNHVHEMAHDAIKNNVEHVMAEPKGKKWVKIIVAILVLLGFVYLNFFTPLRSYINQDNLSNFVNGFGMWAPVVFIIIYILALLFFLPASLFTVFGGVIFGAIYGTVYVVVAATIGAGIGFAITRKFRNKSHNKHKIIQKLVNKIESLVQKNGLQAFIIMRLLYLPYMPLSYAAGLVKTAKWRDFMLATFLTNIVGSFTFVFVGSQLMNGFKALLLPIGLVVLTLFIPKVVKKLHRPVKEM